MAKTPKFVWTRVEPGLYEASQGRMSATVRNHGRYYTYDPLTGTYDYYTWAVEMGSGGPWGAFNDKECVSLREAKNYVIERFNARKAW